MLRIANKCAKQSQIAPTGPVYADRTRTMTHSVAMLLYHALMSRAGASTDREAEQRRCIEDAEVSQRRCERMTKELQKERRGGL